MFFVILLIIIICIHKYSETETKRKVESEKLPSACLCFPLEKETNQTKQVCKPNNNFEVKLRRRVKKDEKVYFLSEKFNVNTKTAAACTKV